MSYRYNPLSGKIEFVGISTADGTSLEATINEKVANLVDSAPATLDTLNELAAALNNDPDFATSTATLLGEKALATDLASLAASLTTVATSGSYADLTGTPTLANIATSGLYSDLSGAPDLSDVATSGAYGDLTGKPDLSDVATSGAYGDLTGKPDLSDVATSGAYGDLTGAPDLFDGDYNSLTNPPVIPAAQVQSDYNQTDDTAVDFIKNKPTLFDGDYNSLTNPPVIPAAQVQSDYNQTDDTAVDFIKNKPTIPTIPTNISSFTNDEGYIDSTSLPTVLSQLTNDQGFITLSGVSVSEADASSIGSLSYDNSTGVFTFTPPDLSLYLQSYTVTQSDVKAHEASLDITEDQITDLKQYLVSTDLDSYATQTYVQTYVGSQGFITDYTVTQSDVTDHQAALTIQGTQIATNTLDYDNLSNKPTIPTVPTALSSFTNDENFINLTESRAGLSVSTDSASGSGSLSYDSGTFTFVPADLSTYLVQSDLSTYALKTYVDTQVAGVVNSAPEALNTLNELAAALGNDDNFATTVTNALSEKANTSDIFSGNYGDLTGAPEIPAAQVQSDYNQTDDTAVDFIKNKPTLFDGDYNSLTNPPVIPTDNNQLTNGAGYLTSETQSDYNQTDDTAVDFIKNKPTIPTDNSQLANGAGYLDSVSESDVRAHEASLTIQGTQIVAGTLDYDNLTNKPTIPTVPTALSSFSNDENFITLSDSQGGLSVSTVTANGAGQLSYNAGVFTFAPAELSSYVTLSDFGVTSLTANGAGSLNYDNSTGTFTFEPADLDGYLTSETAASTYATTTYVNTQVAGIVSSAPETLDTLNELAAALDDDPNFATTVTNQIAAKPDLDDFSVTSLTANGAGSLNYDKTTGTFTFEPANLSPYLTTVTQSAVTDHQAALTIQGTQIVAGTLDYSNLANLPTIPEGADLTGYATQTYVQTYVGDQGFITGYTVTESDVTDHQAALTIQGTQIVAGTLDYSNLTNKPTIPTVPTALSSFTNDENFIDLTQSRSGVSVSSSAANGAGSLNYDNTTGTFTFEPADLSGYLTSATAASTYTTESYVNQKVADLVDSSPTTLDTLNELAAALDDDPNFAATVTTQLGTKATLASFEVNSLTANGAGSLNYDDSTGIFTFEPANLSGYLTEEQDPVFQSSVASGIAPQHIQQWNTAYTWGDHSTVGYLTSQTQADFNQSDSNAVDFIKNKPTIPTVPTDLSGFNNDTNFITISSVPTELSDLTNDIGLITLTQSRSGVSVSSDSASGAGSLNYDSTTGTFTFQPADLSGFLTSQTQADYNQTDSSAVDYILNKPTIPTALSDLTNDENFISAGGLSVSLGDANGSGSLNYNAGTGVFTFAPADLSNYLTTISYAEVTDKPTLFDGDYTNLTNKPTIPTNNNELINGAGYLALVSAPSTSKGASGDAAGDVAMDDNYIYRCTANYTDGVADIWKRVAFSTDTW